MVMLNAVTTLNGCSLAVDKNRPKANPRNQLAAQPTPTPAPPAPSHGHPDLVLMADRTRGPAESYQAQCEKQKQLRGLLASSDCRFEAVVVVLQQALAEVGTPQLTRCSATRTCAFMLWMPGPNALVIDQEYRVRNVIPV